MIVNSSGRWRYIEAGCTSQSHRVAAFASHLTYCEIVSKNLYYYRMIADIRYVHTFNASTVSKGLVCMDFDGNMSQQHT